MSTDDETATRDAHRRGTSRRGLLGAAGGFALAASGLLLPGWLAEETAARPDTAFSGQLGGRRGKNRRGVDKAKRREKKHHGRWNARNGARPGSGAPHIRWIKFFVYNDRPVTTPNQSAAVRGWANENGDDAENSWDRLPLVSLANGTYTGEFELFEYKEGAIVIDDHFYVEADNSSLFIPVSIVLAYGGTMTANGYQGGTRLDVIYLSEDHQSTTNVDGRLFTINRLWNTDDYIVFDVHFT